MKWAGMRNMTGSQIVSIMLWGDGGELNIIESANVLYRRHMLMFRTNWFIGPSTIILQKGSHIINERITQYFEKLFVIVNT